MRREGTSCTKRRQSNIWKQKIRPLANFLLQDDLWYNGKITYDWLLIVGDTNITDFYPHLLHCIRVTDLLLARKKNNCRHCAGYFYV